MRNFALGNGGGDPISQQIFPGAPSYLPEPAMGTAHRRFLDSEGRQNSPTRRLRPLLCAEDLRPTNAIQYDSAAALSRLTALPEGWAYWV